MGCRDRPLQATCLQPKKSLRYQLIVSFGLTTALATIVVVVASILTVRLSGENVKDQTETLLTDQVVSSIRSSSRYVADVVSQKLHEVSNVANVLKELTQDRIVGYPDANYEDDRHVPFRDVFSGANVYPLASDLLPLDWNITQNVNETNYREHTGEERWAWYTGKTISTAHAAYRFQGVCDPSDTDPNSLTYFENCTEANNDISTGGVLQPTETNLNLARKAADLGVYLKPIYEANVDVQIVGVYFANSGAGSSVVFPPAHIDGTSSYVSVGCDWMNSTNPLTGQPYATEQERSRCSKEGDIVPGRLYNPLERGWCRDQALQPGEVLSVGPYLDAFTEGLWMLAMGTAVFDRLTGHFIGCTLFDISIQHIASLLLGGPESDLALVRWEDGTVLASSEWDLRTATETMHVSELSFMDQATFDSFRSLFDFDSEGHTENVYNNTVERHDGSVLAVHPIPVAPYEHDENHRPAFILIERTGGAVFAAIEETNESIEEDVLKVTVWSICIGIFGFLLVLFVTWTVSNMLTRPLQWIEEVSKRILSPEGDKNIEIDLDESEPFFRCTPRSEITDLVCGFRTMILGFSGEGAAVIATSLATEVKNSLMQQQELADLYYQTEIHPEYRESLERRNTETSNTSPETNELRQSVETRETLPISISGSGEPDAGEKKDKVQQDTTTPMCDIPEVVDDEENASEDDMKPDDAEDAPPFQDAAVDEKEAPQSRVQVKEEAKEPESDSVGDTSREDHPEAQAAVVSAVAPPAMPTEPSNPGQGSLGYEVQNSMNSSISSCTMDPMQRRGYVVSNRKSLIGAGLHAGFGRNVLIQTAYASNSGRFRHHHPSPMDRFNQARRSRLFWWIVGLIVAPLFLAMAAICTVVAFEVSAVVPTWLEEAEVVSRSIQQKTVDTAADSLASFTEVVLTDPIRDLHLITRFVEWSLFGGIVLSESLTDIEQCSEECKVYPNGRTCPFFDDDSRAPCDCDWHDLHGHECKPYEFDTRYLQKVFYAGQSHDADENGSRYNISYPETDFSPANTSWWTSLDTLPGAAKGSAASGFETTFDRVRTLSALSAVATPVYNHGTHHLMQHILGVFVGFEADGMIVGFNPCEYTFAVIAHFQSTKENGAAKIRPDLCPLGKFGYDARCRGWYDEGKALGKPYITPPYVFATSQLLVASSATAPLVDPSTGNHVGQTLIDFIPHEFLTTINDIQICDSNNVIAFVITPEADPLGGDTVVGPGYELGSTSPPIEQVVLPYDAEDSYVRKNFSGTVIAAMKAGESGTSTFLRTDEHGTLKKYYIAYAPVETQTLRSVMPGDFSRGVDVFTSLIYSVGVAILEEDLSASFLQTEEEASKVIDRSRAILISIIVVTALAVIVMTSWISIAITRPLIVLLRIVQDINGKRIQDDFPTLDGGSREVQQVYMSLSKFYRLLRSSNIAFFAGNMTLAHKFLNDALVLFQRAHDQKAIGIALNNLANTLFVMHREKVSPTRCRLVNSECVYGQAYQFYTKSIEIAQADYDADSVSRSEELAMLFAEQLANRHFNRGLFLCLTAHDACAPEDAVYRGRADLLQAKQLDCEIREFLVGAKLLQLNSASYFDRLLRRANGLIELLKNDIHVEEVWDVYDLLEEAESLLFVVRRLPNSPLFVELSPLGRLQQLESVALEVQRYHGDISEAARIGMRMMVEDEFIVETAWLKSASALACYLQKKNIPNTEALALSLQSRLKECRTATHCEFGKRVVFVLDESVGEERDLVVQGLANLYSSGCTKKDLVAFINSSETIDDEEAEVARRNPAAFHRRKTIGKQSFPLADEGHESAVTIYASEGIGRALKLLDDSSSESDAMDTWIIAAVGNRHVTSYLALREKIAAARDAAARDANSSSIYLVIIGVNLKTFETASYRQLCQMTRESVYIGLRDESDIDLDDSLVDVRALMNGGGKKLCPVPGGITMEQF